jgi:hypothetical protein
MTVDSSLFKLVEELMRTGHALVRDSVRVSHRHPSTEHAYYLFHFGSSYTDNVQAQHNFLIQEEHLNIPKTYRKNAFWLSVAHFTGRYENAQKESFLVHVYFQASIDRWEIIVQKQADHHPLQTIDIENEDCADLKRFIRQRALPWFDFFKCLLQEKVNRYLRAEKSACEHEARLDALSRQILSNPQNKNALIEEYKNAVTLFNGVLDQVESYGEETSAHPKRRLVLKIMEFFEKQNQKKSDSIERPCPGPEEDKLTQRSILNAESASQPIADHPETLGTQKLVEEITEIEKKYVDPALKSSNPGSLVLFEKHADNLKFSLVFLMQLNDESHRSSKRVSEKNKNILERVYGKLAKIEKIKEVLFQASVESPNAESFKMLFPFMSENRKNYSFHAICRNFMIDQSKRSEYQKILI